MPKPPTPSQAVLYRTLLLEVLDHLKPKPYGYHEHPCLRSCAACRVLFGRIELALQLPLSAVAALTREVERDRRLRDKPCPYPEHADDCDCGGTGGAQ